MEAKSFSENLLPGVHIHACINVADAQLFTFVNITKGLQFSVCIFQPNYVSIWITVMVVERGEHIYSIAN